MMGVYVDDMRAPFGRMLMCHMVADTHVELLEMADRIGVARKWIQQEGQHGEHFDIALTKRALAVKHGAVEITLHELAEKLHARRSAGHALAYGAVPIDLSMALPGNNASPQRHPEGT